MNIPSHTLAFLGNFGGGEMILIFLIVLLLFGAKKVPELFRSLGKGVNEFRKAKNEWEHDINEVMSQEPLEDHDFSESEQKSEKKKSEESVPQEGEKQAAS
ncbi:MAG: twin-arginine translocase TatA/TatE family subunit [Opitutae bacterium]|jgi:sec-independent protein translocase protein TatA|nr:twin-arginine translocase TatA/TatE family subunit [Opitutae bacterium]